MGYTLGLKNMNSIAMFVFGVVIRFVKMFSKERNDDPVSGLIIEIC